MILGERERVASMGHKTCHASVRLLLPAVTHDDHGHGDVMMFVLLLTFLSL